MDHCATVAKGINQLCLTRRSTQDDVKFPPGGRCFHGGGFDDAFRGFYTVGKRYRVRGFLATSFSEDIAEEFLYRAHHRELYPPGQPAIKWIIELDPRGESQFKYRCKQVNLVQRANVAGETEFLFAAFSTFEVLEVAWNAGDGDDPHVVRLRAAIDNLKEAEDLPLAPWY